MPVVGCGYHEHVHGLVVKEGAVVVDQPGHEPGPAFHFRCPLPARSLVDVADVCDGAIRLGGEAVHHGVTTPADAYAGDADLVAGRAGAR